MLSLDVVTTVAILKLCVRKRLCHVKVCNGRTKQTFSSNDKAFWTRPFVCVARHKCPVVFAGKVSRVVKSVVCVFPKCVQHSTRVPRVSPRRGAPACPSRISAARTAGNRTPFPSARHTPFSTLNSRPLGLLYIALIGLIV